MFYVSPPSNWHDRFNSSLCIFIVCTLQDLSAFCGDEIGDVYGACGIDTFEDALNIRHSRAAFIKINIKFKLIHI